MSLRIEDYDIFYGSFVRTWGAQAGSHIATWTERDYRTQMRLDALFRRTMTPDLGSRYGSPPRSLAYQMMQRARGNSGSRWYRISGREWALGKVR